MNDNERDKIKFGAVDYTYAIIIGVFSILFLISAFNAEASIIASQIDSSDSNGNSYFIYTQAIASSTVGIPYSVSFYMSDSNTREAMKACIFASTTTPSGNCSTAIAVSASSTPFASKTLNTFLFSTSYSLSAGQQYFVKVYPNDDTADTSFNLYGANVGSFTTCFVNNPPLSGCDTKSLYYVLFSTVSIATTSSYISTINSPLNGSVTATNVVNFNFDYFLASDYLSYPYALIHLQDLTTGQQLIVDPQLTFGSGSGNYSDYVTLINNHFYTWQGCIGSGSGALLCSDVQGFSVVSTALSSILPANFEEGTTTNEFVSIPYNFFNRYPFRFVFDLGSWLTSFGTNATSSTSTVMVFKEVSNGNQFILSTTTPIDYTHAVDHSIFGFIRNVMGVVFSVTIIWVAIATFTKIL